MNEAIKLAIEKGGYKYGMEITSPIDWIDKDNFKIGLGRGIEILNKHAICADNLFWQALGKALGNDWTSNWFRCENSNCTNDNDYVAAIYCSYCGGKLKPFQKQSEWYKTKALEYFDLLLTGGDTEQFWKELLK